MGLQRTPCCRYTTPEGSLSTIPGATTRDAAVVIESEVATRFACEMGSLIKKRRKRMRKKKHKKLLKKTRWQRRQQGR